MLFRSAGDYLRARKAELDELLVVRAFLGFSLSPAMLAAPLWPTLRISRSVVCSGICGRSKRITWCWISAPVRPFNSLDFFALAPSECAPTRVRLS